MDGKAPLARGRDQQSQWVDARGGEPVHVRGTFDSLAGRIEGPPPSIDLDEKIAHPERKGAVERLFTDEEVDAAKTAPPPDTRARMRGEFIKLARENSIQYDLDWSNIRLGNLLNVRVICNNPFETDTQKVAELVRTIQKTNLRKTSLSKLVIQS